MTFPLSRIRRLGEYDGQWWLGVRCRCCQHARRIPAEFFIKLFGKQQSLAYAVKRLYCANCRGKRCRCEGQNFEAKIGLPRM